MRKNARILHFTDCHLNPLSVKPSSRTDAYHDQIDAKWAALSAAVIQNQVDHVAFSGDLFHLKAQSQYQPRDTNRTISKIEALGRPVSLIPGNHDLPKSSIDNYNETAFKAVISGARNATDVSMDDKGQVRFLNQPVTVDGQPTNIVINGMPYVPMSKFKEMAAYFHQATGMATMQDKFIITMLHVDALPAPNALPLPFETFIWKELTEMFPYSDMLLLGHIHQAFPMQVIPTSTGKNQIISKPWAMARNVNDIYVRTEVLEAQHKPGYTMIDIDLETKQVQAQYVDLPFAPFAEAFNAATLAAEIKGSKQISAIIDSLQNFMKTSNLDTEDNSPTAILMRLAKESNAPQQVIETTLEYLHAAGVK